MVGFNSRLDAVQAAILRVKLQYLDSWNEARRDLARRYNEYLAESPVTTPNEAPGVYHVYHQYTIRAHRRDELQAFLQERGIGSIIYYPQVLYSQQIYAGLGYAEGCLPIAEQAAREALSLPMYPELTHTQQEQVVQGIVDFHE